MIYDNIDELFDDIEIFINTTKNKIEFIYFKETDIYSRNFNALAEYYGWKSLEKNKSKLFLFSSKNLNVNENGKYAKAARHAANLMDDCGTSNIKTITEALNSGDMCKYINKLYNLKVFY